MDNEKNQLDEIEEIEIDILEDDFIEEPTKEDENKTYEKDNSFEQMDDVKLNNESPEESVDSINMFDVPEAEESNLEEASVEEQPKVEEEVKKPVFETTKNENGLSFDEGEEEVAAPVKEEEPKVEEVSENKEVNDSTKNEEKGEKDVPEKSKKKTFALIIVLFLIILGFIIALPTIFDLIG